MAAGSSSTSSLGGLGLGLGDRRASLTHLQLNHSGPSASSSGFRRVSSSGSGLGHLRGPAAAIPPGGHFHLLAGSAAGSGTSTPRSSRPGTPTPGGGAAGGAAGAVGPSAVALAMALEEQDDQLLPDLDALLDAAADPKVDPLQVVQAARELVARQPVVLAQADANGWLPLHHVLVNRSIIMDLVIELCTAYPDALQTATRRGSLPLHLACMNKTMTLPVVSYVLAAWPEAASVADGSGRLPAHCVAAFCSNPEIASLIISAFPAALLHQADDGQLPLHCFAMNDAPSFEVVRRFILAEPGALRVRDHSGFFPLEDEFIAKVYKDVEHLLTPTLEEDDEEDLRSQAAAAQLLTKYTGPVDQLSADTFQTALHDLLLSPPSAITVDPADAFPLHEAARRGFALDIIVALLRLFPHVIRRQDSHGRFALHEAILTAKPRLDVIERLVAANPAAVAAPESDGLTPLHIAAKKQVSAPIMEALAIANPEACALTDSLGRTPLHLYCISPNKIDIGSLEALVRAAPAVCRSTDRAGRTPLHCVASHDAHGAQSFEVLVAADPSAALVTDETGCTPLHVIVQQSGVGITAVRVLLRHGPSAARVQNRRLQCPLHIAVQNLNADYSLIRELCRACPEACDLLDDSGLSPLHLACQVAVPSVQAIQAMLEVHPPCAAVPTADSRDLALHLICTAPSIDTRIVTELVRAFPNSTSMKNAAGRIPADIAATHANVTLDLIKKLTSRVSPAALLSVVQALKQHASTNAAVSDFVHAVDVQLLAVGPSPTSGSVSPVAGTGDEEVETKASSPVDDAIRNVADLALSEAMQKSMVRDLQSRVAEVAHMVEVDLAGVTSRLEEMDDRTGRMEAALEELAQALVAIQAAQQAPPPEPETHNTCCCIQ